MSEMSRNTASNHKPVDDNIIIDWDGPNDLDNPMNWAPRKRYLQTILISIITLNVNLASTMFAPGAPMLMAEMGVTSSTIGSLTVSIYVLGFAIGPLILSPLSEIYGRLILYHCCNLVFLAFTTGCALSTDITMFLIFRFIAGCAGSAPMTIGGGTIADIFPQEKRGSVMGMFAMGPIIGPIVGPVAGGFVAQELGWRWTFWILLIISGAVNIFALLVLRETYAPVLLARKTARVQKSTNNFALRSRLDRGVPAKVFIKQAIERPLRLLLFSPIVLLLSLYVAFCFGLTYLLFTTFPAVYSAKYHFSTSTAGLSYLGMGIGLMLGVVVFAVMSDKILQMKARGKTETDAGTQEITATPIEKVESQEGDTRDTPKAPKYQPELRLYLMVWLAPVLPFGFFWYGWSAQEGVHWIVPILGTSLIGIGSLFITMPALTYLVDVFGSEAAASALAANTLLRALLGAFLPLAGEPLYDSLGLGWGNSLLGFIGLAFMPVPFLFYKYGETIRTKWPTRL